MAADLSARDRDRWLERGINLISPERGLDALDLLLSEGDSHAAVLPVFDWPRFTRRLTSGRQPAFFSALPVPDSGRLGQESRLSRGHILKTIRAAPAFNRRSLLESFLRDCIAAVLGDHTPIEPHTGFFQMGMDSLMTMELRSAVQDGLDYELPHTFTFNYGNLADLSDFLVAELSLAPDAASPGATAAGSDNPDGETGAMVAALSGADTEQLSDMLDAELAELGQLFGDLED
jgi:acyl carrier protein